MAKRRGQARSRGQGRGRGRGQKQGQGQGQGRGRGGPAGPDRREREREAAQRREEEAREEYERLQARRDEAGPLERDLAILGSTMLVGAVFNFAWLVVLSNSVTSVDQLLDPDNNLFWITMSFFVGAAVRVFAAASLWMVDRVGRILHLIGVISTSAGIVSLVLLAPDLTNALVFLIPPLIIAGLCWRPSVSKVLGEREFRDQVLPATHTARPFDMKFWVTHGVLLLLGAVLVKAVFAFMNSIR